MESLLDLDRICVKFGGLNAVDDVSIKVAPGERRALIGPNGAGKTTLFNVITGVVPASSGKVVFMGEDITREPVHKRSRRGISRTFQITNLFATLTVLQNMQLALLGLGYRKFSVFGTVQLDGQAEDRIGQALQVSQLESRRHTQVQELSYGEQRQLEIAMALVSDPRLLLFDEPAAGLSPSERGVLADIIRGLPQNLTIVLIDHDMDLVMKLVDGVSVLSNGVLLAEGRPEEIRSNQEVQDVYFGRARQDA